MLASLEIHNSFAFDIYMDDKADMIFHLYHSHLEQYFIQQKSDIYVSIIVSLLQLIHIFGVRENIQHSMLANTEYIIPPFTATTKKYCIKFFYIFLLHMYMLNNLVRSRSRSDIINSYIIK